MAARSLLVCLLLVGCASAPKQLPPVTIIQKVPVDRPVLPPERLMRQVDGRPLPKFKQDGQAACLDEANALRYADVLEQQRSADEQRRAWYDSAKKVKP